MSVSLPNRLILLAAMVVFAGFVSVFWVLQSDWFRESIRQQIIAKIQNVTGGRAELKTLHLHWHSLTADLEGIIVHGTEPREERPLFQASSLRLRLRVVSLLKRDIDITFLQVEDPRLHLLLQADGKTNLPDSQRINSTQLINQLLQIKLQRANLHHGLLEINDQRIPLDLTADNIALGLVYNRTGPHYDLSFTSSAMDVQWAETHSLKGSLQFRSQFAQNYLTVMNAVIHLEDSVVELNGDLQNFARPVIRWNIQSQLAAPQLAKALHVGDIASGTINIGGSGYRDAHTPFTFTGEMDGQRLSYAARSLRLNNISLKSKLTADENGIRFADLDLAGPNIRWNGKAELTDYRKLSLNGEITGLDLRTVATALGTATPEWSAVVHGPVSIDGLLRPRLEDFAATGDLQLSPATGSPPVSGNFAFAYRQRGNALELRDSKLNLPNTTLAISGVPGANLKVSLDSTNLADLRPVLSLAHQPIRETQLPTLLPNGRAHFDGRISGSLSNPQITGDLALANFRIDNANWQDLRSTFSLGKSGLALSSLIIRQGILQGRAAGQIALANWKVEPNSALHLQGQFSGLDVAQLSGFNGVPQSLSLAGGLASGSFAVSGTVLTPTGNAQVNLLNTSLHGEHLDSLATAVKLDNGQLQLMDGKAKSGAAAFNFTGSYRHDADSWQRGTLSLDLDSNVFPLSTLFFVRQRVPDLSAQTRVRLKTSLLLAPDQVQLGRTDGSISLHNIAANGIEYGSIIIGAATHGQTVEGNLSGNLGFSPLSGTAQLQLSAGMPVKAQVQFGELSLHALTAILLPAYSRGALSGSVRGSATIEGPLQQWEKLRAAVKLDELQVTSPDHQANLIFHNSAPVLLEAANGVVVVQSAELTGRDTRLSISGSVPLSQNRPMQLKVNGAVDLRIAELFNPNLQSFGGSRISAVLGGTPANPDMTGTLDIHGGSLTLSNFPNGITDLNGTVQFEKNRATLQKITARSGGGNVSFGGFVTFSAAHSLVYRVEADSQDVRVRYAGGVSVTSSSQLTLSGTSQNSLLSGNITVSRVIFNPNADIGTLLASTTALEPVGKDADFLSGLQFDVHVDSTPNLQLDTSLSRDVQASVDLQLRGNSKTPILLGSIEADEGDIRAFGSRYSINRGQINFINPARIEPVLDLDLRTQARGINVDITIAGTLGKLNINYRSDPPLQPRDIIALLTVGRAPGAPSDVPNTQLTNTDVSALQAGANTVLGQAVSPASSRLQKLFGIANIKIDPLVQGITNTSQGRLTLEQQISRQITVTYVTNLSQTSEQIFRLEYALNPQFSLVALRDDNGEFGIDILYKKRFK